MNTQLCHYLLEHVLASTEDPRLLASEVLYVCKLWNSLVARESFWEALFRRVYLFSILRSSSESWRAACLRMGRLTSDQRTEALLAKFDVSSALQKEVRDIFGSIGHDYFPYFAPLHRVYPGGYALLLFKINKLDTQQLMAEKVQQMKGQMCMITEEQQRLRILADFWTSEVQYWKSLGEADHKDELHGIGNAIKTGNPSSAHWHMKVWFDKIQMWIMGPSHLFENLFQQEVIYNKPFMQQYFPCYDSDRWSSFWRNLRLQSLTTLEDM